jgi:hypothetical protein|tara:strand:- start:810 stop:956 length:147 start_codon:yes stop_codon:yes gene_type:complete
MRKEHMKADKNENGIFSNNKPKRIPKFWYPLVCSVILTWIIFTFFIVN